MMLAVWAAQIFLSRLSFTWILGASAVLLSCIFVAYMTFAHVRQRVDNFLLAGSGSEHYQVVKSLEAFSSGGVLGLGPGRGVIKNSLPDGHADFVLAVIGEEFGTVACICIILSYLVISFSCIMRARAMDSEFCISAAIGLALQLHLQALVNIGVVIRLLPTTGVTLPLISYGGSSMMATGMTVGAMLALTRHRALLL
jgi:cell division protein FtsW